MARKFGDTLLNKGASFVNLTSFDYYDRMMPAQDFLKKEGLGNLIALPLQGDVVNAGRSVFVDENWEPYENQFDKRLRAYKKIGGFMFNDDSKNNLQSDYSCNAIYDYETYGPVYQLDVCEAKSEVIISSPILSHEKIGWLIEIASKKQVNGVKFKIVTMDTDEYKYGDSLKWELLHEEIKASGIEIILSQNEDKKFTVIDNNIVWYGSLNFLGKSSVEDNLMRVINKSIAEEVIGIACK